MESNAFLAIWSDVSAENEVDYLHWLTREHTTERLSVDGFCAVRAYRAIDAGICRYFIHYELTSPAVLDSDSYLRRLNTPTPWSQRIMPILGNFVRGGGQVSHAFGTGHGGVLGAVKFAADPYPDSKALQSIASRDLIVAARLLETDTGRTTLPTKEKSMREGDSTFSALLLVEGLQVQAVEEALTSAGLGAQAELFRQVFHL